MASILDADWDERRDGMIALAVDTAMTEADEIRFASGADRMEWVRRRSRELFFPWMERELGAR